MEKFHKKASRRMVGESTGTNLLGTYSQHQSNETLDKQHIVTHIGENVFASAHFFFTFPFVRLLYECTMTAMTSISNTACVGVETHFLYHYLDGYLEFRVLTKVLNENVQKEEAKNQIPSSLCSPANENCF